MITRLQKSFALSEKSQGFDKGVRLLCVPKYFFYVSCGIAIFFGMRSA